MRCNGLERQVSLRCIGPNMVTGSFGPENKKFADFEGLPTFTNYVPVNYTIYPAAQKFNFDNLELASVVMFSFFYKNSWVQFMELTVESTHIGVMLLFFGIIIVISYYLLNLTVGFVLTHTLVDNLLILQRIHKTAAFNTERYRARYLRC